jgi:hypothetical protein
MLPQKIRKAKTDQLGLQSLLILADAQLENKIYTFERFCSQADLDRRGGTWVTDLGEGGLVISRDEMFVEEVMGFLDKNE